MPALSQNAADLSGKTAIVRANYDVPMENGQVEDTTRIEDSLSTLNFLLENNIKKIIILAHYDRPEGKPDPDKSLKPVTSILSNLLNQPVAFAQYQSDYHQLAIPEEKVVLVENLRFWQQEESNDPDFAQHLASLGDIYVNEAFANCHRSHASIVGIPSHLPSYLGLSLQKEVDILTKVLKNPQKPLVVIIGGAKLETKEPLVTVFAPIADTILVGGKIALDLQGKTGLPTNVKLAQLTEDGKDITEASAKEFAQIIQSAQTVVWNGTMGVFEEPEHLAGTKIVAEAVNTTPAFTLAGGGDTETALTQLDTEGGIDHISTGGGAMLTFLTEGTLVGLEAIS